MTGRDVDAAGGFLAADGVGDDRGGRIAIGQPRLEPVPGHDLGTAHGELAREKPGIVADDDTCLGPRRRVVAQDLGDAVSRELEVVKGERVTDDPAPTGCSKFDDRHVQFLMGS